MICTCGRDMWLYDSNTWTCKAGHKEPFTSPVVRTIPPKRSTFAYELAATAGVTVAVSGLFNLLVWLL